MSFDPNKIKRDRGTLTINGADVGFTSSEQAGLEFYSDEIFDDIFVEEYGRAPISTFYMGVRAYSIVTLAQKDATALATAFLGRIAGNTVDYKLDTPLPPGTQATLYTFTWSGSICSISAPKSLVMPRPQMPMVYGVTRPNEFPLLIRHFPDPANSYRVFIKTLL